MKTATNKLPFYNNCVDWKESEMTALMNIIRNVSEITRATFLKHVDKKEFDYLSTQLGYDRNFPMTKDWHVSYHRLGKVYYFKYSAIEYVFATDEMIKKLNEKEF